MSRKFITAVLAATLAVTSFVSTPARAASEEDIAKLLAGAATLFIIGKAIESNRDGKKKKKVVVQQPRKQVYQQPRARQQPQYRDQRQHRRVGLPQRCLRFVETRRGTMRVFAKRCMDRNYQSARPLPQQCLRRFERQDAPRRAYTARCLRENGYRLAGR